MKKMITFLAISLSITAANAQKIKETDVPAVVKIAFVKMYPGIKTAQWDKENNQFEARFTNGSYIGSVLFDAAGKWTERETSIPVSKLPQKVKTYMQSNHKNEKLLGAAKIIKANREVNYEAEVKGKDLIFDANGNFIKEFKE